MRVEEYLLDVVPLKGAAVEEAVGPLVAVLLPRVELLEGPLLVGFNADLSTHHITIGVFQLDGDGSAEGVLDHDLKREAGIRVAVDFFSGVKREDGTAVVVRGRGGVFDAVGAQDLFRAI